MKFSLLRICALPALFLGFVALSCRDTSAPGANLPIQTQVEQLTSMKEPTTDGLWTSTREIRALQSAPDGLWAATGGGVLHFDGQKWTKWSRQNGLPSNEAQDISLQDKAIVARFPIATSTMENGKWQNATTSVFSPVAKSFLWKGQTVSATLEGLQLGKTSVPLPTDSVGTHISAIQVQDAKTLLVAIYGDGLWRFDGARWTRVYPDLPANAHEITALAGDAKKSLWIGTRRDGLFRHQNGKWTSFLQADEPFSHNVQFLAQFQGVLWASTLDDGLVCRTANGWKHFSTPTLSSSAPRQMVVWKDRLYVRHGGGLVDSFDGRNWMKNDLATIPRKGVYALAGDENLLYAAGWGGWSEWNGSNWAPHFDVAELKGVPILGLLPDGDNMWIETQSRGLGRWTRKRGEFRWFDERDGLSDDWVTAVAKIDGKIYAGTFVGGLARLDGDKWTVFSELKGLNVTAIDADGQGGVYAATRHGLWHVKDDKVEKVDLDWLDNEQQTLLMTKSGVWVGTRTSLDFLKTGDR